MGTVTWGVRHRGNEIASEAACPRGSSAMSTVAIVDSIQLWLTMTGRMP